MLRDAAGVLRRAALWPALCVFAAAVSLAASSAASAIRPARLHVELRASDPAANDTVATPPRAIRLDFTQAIELPLTRVVLSGADSASIPLAPVRAADATDDRAVVADVPSRLGAGTYRVRWTVTSRDAHTIRGEFQFTVLASATDTTQPSIADADTTAVDAASRSNAEPMVEGEFDARSPAYTVIRWLTYAGILGVVGALFFRVGVVPTVQRRLADVHRHVTERALAAARLGAIGSAVLLLIAAMLRLAAQARAVFGDAALDAVTLSPLLGGTAWGRAWIAQVLAAVVTLGIAMRPPTPRWKGRAGPVELVGVVAVLTLALSAAVSGHPAAASPRFLAVGTDALHLLAVGGWIGTLGYVVCAGIPATAGVDAEARPLLVRDIVTTFSAIALVCVATILVTGVVSSWLEMRAISALWTTPYGQVLMVKLGLVALVAAAGAYNWRVATPRLLAGGGISRIRSVMVVELLFAVCVLGATAFLTATPPPIDTMASPISFR